MALMCLPLLHVGCPVETWLLLLGFLFWSLPFFSLNWHNISCCGNWFAATSLLSQWSPAWVTFMEKIQSTRETANKLWFTFDHIKMYAAPKNEPHKVTASAEGKIIISFYISFPFRRNELMSKTSKTVICQKLLTHEPAQLPCEKDQLSSSRRWWEAWLQEISSFWECATPKRYIISSSTPAVKCLYHAAITWL